MPLDLYISNITGTPPYEINVCDCTKVNCYPVGTGIVIPPPFQFTIPNELSGETCYLLQIIDAAGCVIEEIINLGGPLIGDCANTAYAPPVTINGITITATYTGDVLFPTPFDPLPGSCNNNQILNIPNNPLVGFSAPFSYTYSFSQPVNSAVLTIKGTGVKSGFQLNPTDEIFTITTNGGIPSIDTIISCETTISGNIINSGANTPYVGGSGGRFIITAPNPYTTLTVSGPQNIVGGSILQICLNSSNVNTLWQRVVPLTTPTPSVTEGYIYPTPSVTKTPGPTPSITRTNTPTPTPSLTQGFTPGVYFFVHIPNGNTLTCP